MLFALLLAALVPPHPLTPLAARHPGGAEVRDLAADVELELTISAEGAVSEANVAVSAGAAFDTAAVEAARALTFAPGELDGKKTTVRIRYLVHFAAPPVAATVGDAILRGRVLERGTRDPLSAATVEIAGASTSTDEEGAFEIHAPAGDQQIVVSAPGHFSATVDAALPAEILVRLAKDDLNPYSAAITAPRGAGATVRTLARDEVQVVPGTQGDVLRAVADLPGVARPPLGLGVLIVRGGAPEDTKVFIEGDEVPLAFHLGALTAVVNTDSIDALDFIPGAFPARFGRATSGIIDLRTRAGGDRLHGYLQADLVNATAFAEGPLGSPETGTFLVSARRSYLSKILGAVLPLTGADLTVAPNFWDYEARADLKQRVGDLHFGVLGSQDHLDLTIPQVNADPRDSVGSATGFHRAFVSWTRSLGKMVSALQLAGGFDLVDVAATRAVTAHARTYRATVREELRAPIAQWLTLAGGLDAQVGSYAYTFTSPNPFSNGAGGSAAGASAALLTEKVAATAIEPAIYAQGTVTLGRVTLVPGLRYDHSDLVKNGWLDPRLAAALDLGNYGGGALTLKAAAGQFHEHPRPDLLIPLYGNPALLPEKSMQASVGAVWTREAGQVEITGYAAQLSELPAFTTAVAPSAGGVLSPLNFVSTGTGTSRGLELLARWTPRPGTFAWLAYTFSRSFRDDHQGRGLVRYDFDQPHVLTAVASTKLPGGFTVGARLRYATGNPTTPVARAVVDARNGGAFAIDGDSNTDRLPDFFELDLRADKAWTFDRWTLGAYLDVMNATNHANAERWKYNYDFSERTPYSGVPFFPSIGLKAQL